MGLQTDFEGHNLWHVMAFSVLTWLDFSRSVACDSSPFCARGDRLEVPCTNQTCERQAGGDARLPDGRGSNWL